MTIKLNGYPRLEQLSISIFTNPSRSAGNMFNVTRENLCQFLTTFNGEIMSIPKLTSIFGRQTIENIKEAMAIIFDSDIMSTS